MNDFLEQIVEDVVKIVKSEVLIEVEASGRHVHLCRRDIDSLFGQDYQLTKVKDLSQPGQYACKERITLEGPKATLKNVIVLGPERKESQVEISLTDALILGVTPPIKQSGELSSTLPITLVTESASVYLDRGLMVAKRHLHMTPEDAEKFNVGDGDIIKVKVFGARPLIFDDVVVRVNKDFRTYMHIDYDEANACGFTPGTLGMIVR